MVFPPPLLFDRGGCVDSQRFVSPLRSGARTVAREGGSAPATPPPQRGRTAPARPSPPPCALRARCPRRSGVPRAPLWGSPRELGRRPEGAGPPLRALREPRASLGRGRTKAPSRGAWRPRAFTGLHRSPGFAAVLGGHTAVPPSRRAPRRPCSVLHRWHTVRPAPRLPKREGLRRTHRAELLRRNVTSASEPPDNKAPAGPCAPTPGRAEQLLMQVP